MTFPDNAADYAVAQALITALSLDPRVACYKEHPRTVCPPMSSKKIKLGLDFGRYSPRPIFHDWRGRESSSDSARFSVYVQAAGVEASSDLETGVCFGYLSSTICFAMSAQSPPPVQNAKHS
jgi:hypothetical protein